MPTNYRPLSLGRRQEQLVAWIGLVLVHRGFLWPFNRHAVPPVEESEVVNRNEGHYIVVDVFVASELDDSVA